LLQKQVPIFTGVGEFANDFRQRSSCRFKLDAFPPGSKRKREKLPGASSLSQLERFLPEQGVTAGV